MASAAETAILSGRGGWPRILIELALLYALPPTRANGVFEWYRFVIAQCTGGRGWSALPGMEVVKPSDVQLEVAVLASVKSEYRQPSAQPEAHLWFASIYGKVPTRCGNR